MTICLIVDPDKDAYCGKPATTTFGKLQACDECAAELRMRIAIHDIESRMADIERQLEQVTRATIMLAEACERPRTAQALRELRCEFAEEEEL